MSDRSSRGERADESGGCAREILERCGLAVAEAAIVADEADQIRAWLIEMSDDRRLDLLVTTGGTGLSPRDSTPEATAAVVEKEIPGIAEAMRAESMRKTPTAMLSRAVAGIRGRTMIVNLPGSPKAVRECLEVIMPAVLHGLEVMSGRPVDG